MRKLLVILLVVSMIFSLVACGQSGSSGTEKTAVNEGNAAESQETQNTDQAKDEPAPTSDGKVEIVIWGLNPLSVGSGNKEMIEAFDKSHPNIKLVPQSTPGSGSYSVPDDTKLLAAIAGGTPPDVTWFGRFQAAGYASRNAFTPIDDFVKASGLDLSQYAGYTLDELRFDGKLWGLPWDTDTRILYWNKDLFKAAGLDPETPPNTWDELLDYAKKLTKTDAKGNLKQIGFIPNFGNSWLYLYGFQNGANFLSEDGKTAELNDPKLVEALEFMVKGYDELGGAKKINAYASTFQGEANDPFLTGKVAMLISVNNAVTGYSRFNPNMNYGAALAPTPDGNNKVTWSGGWSFCIPNRVKHPQESFEVIKWLTTEGIVEQAKGAAAYNKSKGNDIYIPFPAAYMPANETLEKTYVDPIQNETIKKAYYVGMDAMKVSKPRPPSPVGEALWMEHARATDKAIYHEMNPKEALDAGNKIVQEELDKFWADYKPQE